jgi:hypothetical protein
MYLRSLTLPVVLASARVAGCALVVTELMRVLIDVSPTSPLIGAMVALRRSVMLDHIQVSAAVAEFEMIVLGRRASHLIQSRVSLVIDACERTREQHRRVAEIFDSVRAIESTPNEVMEPAKKSATLGALMLELESRGATVTDLTRETKSQRERLHRYVMIFRLESPDVTDLLASVDAANEKMIKEIESARDSAMALHNHLQARAAAAKALNAGQKTEP